VPAHLPGLLQSNQLLLPQAALRRCCFSLCYRGQAAQGQQLVERGPVHHRIIRQLSTVAAAAAAAARSISGSSSSSSTLTIALPMWV